MEPFAIVVNGYEPWTIVAKLSISDVCEDPGYVRLLGDPENVCIACQTTQIVKAIPSPTLLRSKKKKRETKETKERVSKQKLLKGCQRVQDATALAILERVKFKNISCRPPSCTILFSVLWPLHFQIHFSGPVSGLIFGIIWGIK